MQFEHDFHRVIVQMRRVLNARDEGTQAALAGRGHRIRAAHVQGSKDEGLKVQDFVHVVEHFHGELEIGVYVVLGHGLQLCIGHLEVARERILRVKIELHVEELDVTDDELPISRR